MWNNIIGQNKVKLFLKNILLNERIHNAYIFYGKNGVGKDAIALEFAKVLNCDNLNNEHEACNKCKSCTDIQKFQSRYVKFITALPSSKSEIKDDNVIGSLSTEDYETYLSELEKKSQNLYYKVNIPKANNIRIDSIRQMIKEAYMTVSETKKKVFIISDCDLMNQNTANSLLKILEEPPSNTLIILTTSRLNSLLPTIIGRCQLIRFETICNEDIINYLRNQFNIIDDSEIKLLSSISQGSLGIFQDLDIETFMKFRDNVINMLRNLITHKNISLAKSVSNIIETRDRNMAKLSLFIIILWFKDVNSYNIRNENQIINKDLVENISLFGKKFNADVFKIINLVEDAIRDIDSNINLELLFYNLLLRIKSCIKINKSL